MLLKGRCVKLDATKQVFYALDTPGGYGKIMQPAEIAQLVEHATENCGVHSSILCLGISHGKNTRTRVFFFFSFPQMKSKSLVEFALYE